MIPVSVTKFLSKFTSDFMGSAFSVDGIREPDPGKKLQAKVLIDEIGTLRGRPLIYPMVPTGKGSGPFIELTDGSVKMDMICGIGVHIFGHNHPEIMLAALKGAVKSPTIQGTLMPGEEMAKLSRLLVNAAQGIDAHHALDHLDDDAKSTLAGAWITTCGTMANEICLKIIRQKKFPAYKIIAFKNNFAGRSVAMQELTDEPKYREGQPLFDQVTHIPFYDDAMAPDKNIQVTKDELKKVVAAEPGKYAGFCFEIVQGEGGAFRTAPKEWWREILSYAKSLGLAVWADEIQTTGRTREFFAMQTFGVADLVDVLATAKPLQVGVAMWTPEYAPKAGLIAGTFAGATTSLAVGVKIVEMLLQGGYYGPHGKIQRLETMIKTDIDARRLRLKEKGLSLGRLNICGGMVAMEILDGKAETIKNFLNKLFDKGIIGFSAGRSPVMLRFLPPVGVLTEAHWKICMDLVEGTLDELSHP